MVKVSVTFVVSGRLALGYHNIVGAFFCDRVLAPHDLVWAADLGAGLSIVIVAVEPTLPGAAL